jgi:DNA-binding IscR family transcriptional regulator
MLELFRGQGLLVQSAEDGGYMLARSPEDLGVLDLLRLVRQGDLAAATDEKGAAATRLAPQALPPAMARTIKDLADEPLESIQTFAI